MKLKAAIFAVALTALSIGTLRAATQEIKKLKLEAGEISILTSRVILNGSARVRSQDKIKKTSFDASAKKITADFFPAENSGPKLSGVSAVKSAVMDGPVKIVYTEQDANGNTVKTTAMADSATYDGAEQKAYLLGNVRIVNEDPTQFEEPSVMTGDRGMINLKPNLGPEEVRYKIESAPGLSSVEVTPKPQPKKGTK